MPISPDQLPERLQKALVAADVEITELDPNPDCTANGPGFCNGKCANLDILKNQAVAATVTDARLAQAAANLTRSWAGCGCTVLRFRK